MPITKTSIQKLLKKIWSLCVRTRDLFACQWCGKVSNRNHAHHIVSRSLSNKIGYYDMDNGMTLCFRCHIIRLKSEVDEYVAMRDKWLARRKLNYQDMRDKYRQKSNLLLDDFLVMFHNLKKKLVELNAKNEDNIVYDDNLPTMSVGKRSNRKAKPKSKRSSNR